MAIKPNLQEVIIWAKYKVAFGFITTHFSFFVGGKFNRQRKYTTALYCKVNKLNTE